MSKKINIIGIDETKTRKSEKGTKTMYFYIELSKTPSLSWENIFLEEQKYPTYNEWVPFALEGKYVIINTTKNELKVHLEELEKNITIINEKLYDRK